MPEWFKEADSSSTSASCVGSSPTVVMLPLNRPRREICLALRAQTTLGCLEPVWPSGPRRWLQAPDSKGAGWNPTAVSRVGVALVSPRPATFFRGLFPLASAMAATGRCDLRRWLKAPARKGVGSNPTVVTRFALFLRSACASCQAKSTTPAGLEPATPGSAGRCLIDWAMGPLVAIDVSKWLLGMQPAVSGASWRAPAVEVPRCWRALGEASLRAWRRGGTSDSRSEV